MDKFKKIIPIIMEYFEKYISENEIMDEFQKQIGRWKILWRYFR